MALIPYGFVLVRVLTRAHGSVSCELELELELELIQTRMV
jgi:hypothetical protein